ncbi:TetR/AcrR family transcriptional regulator [Devosia sp. 1635]|uniref:TetR/AcrR family transcriptional regulator n=1 Tax=Devosia sp. 1635 TaxID=2726066 RepID=UPI00156524E4|nr:TetR/AcrR family transcriptional regulator [Devosia sp. 1635]
MDKRDDIVAGASGVFETSGFRGVGVDAVLVPSGASTRTLYKHFGSRDGLVLAVLEERHRRFMQKLVEIDPADPVGDLFDKLQQWLDDHGAHGCMLLRARSEYADTNPEIVALVRRQKNEFERDIARRVALSLGGESTSLTVQIWLLFEGATAAASISGSSVVSEARQAASVLVAIAREQVQ